MQRTTAGIMEPSLFVNAWIRRRKFPIVLLGICLAFSLLPSNIVNASSCSVEEPANVTEVNSKCERITLLFLRFLVLYVWKYSLAYESNKNNSYIESLPIPAHIHEHSLNKQTNKKSMSLSSLFVLPIYNI